MYLSAQNIHEPCFTTPDGLGLEPRMDIIDCCKQSLALLLHPRARHFALSYKKAESYYYLSQHTQNWWCKQVFSLPFLL